MRNWIKNTTSLANKADETAKCRSRTPPVIPVRLRPAPSIQGINLQTIARGHKSTFPATVRNTVIVMCQSP